MNAGSLSLNHAAILICTFWSTHWGLRLVSVCAAVFRAVCNTLWDWSINNIWNGSTYWLFLQLKAMIRQYTLFPTIISIESISIKNKGNVDSYIQTSTAQQHLFWYKDVQDNECNNVSTIRFCLEKVILPFVLKVILRRSQIKWFDISTEKPKTMWFLLSTETFGSAVSCSRPSRSTMKVIFPPISLGICLTASRSQPHSSKPEDTKPPCHTRQDHIYEGGLKGVRGDVRLLSEMVLLFDRSRRQVMIYEVQWPTGANE